MKSVLDREYGKAQFGELVWKTIEQALAAYVIGDYQTFGTKFFELAHTGKTPVTFVLLYVLRLQTIPDDESRKVLSEQIWPALDSDDWCRAVGEFIEGRCTSADLWKLVDNNSDRLLQFHYYHGEVAKQLGNETEANSHFRSAIAIPSMQMESWLAIIALSSVRLPMNFPGKPPMGSLEIPIPQFENFIDPLEVLEDKQPSDTDKERAEGVSQKALHHSALAHMHRARGNTVETRTHFHAAINAQLLISKKDDDPWLAKMLSEQADFEEQEGNLKAAFECYEQTISIVDKAPDPPHESFAILLGHAGTVATELGMYDEAKRWYERALAMGQAAYGPESASAGIAMDNLAYALSSNYEYLKAESLYQQAGEIFKKEKTTLSEDYAVNRAGLGKLYLRMGRHDEALTLIEESFDIYRSLFPENHDRVATGYQSMGLAYLEAGRYVEAETMLRHAIDLRAKLVGENHPALAPALTNLSTVLDHLGKEEEVVELCEKAISISKEAFGTSSINHAMLLLNSVGPLRTLGRNSEANARCDEAIQIIRQDATTTQSFMNGYGLLRLGESCMETNDYRGAYAYFKEADEVFKATLPPENPDRIILAGFKQGDLFEQVGQHEKAAALYNKLDASLTLDQSHPKKVELARRQAAAAYYLGDLGTAAFLLGKALNNVSEELVTLRQRLLADLGNVYAAAGNEKLAVEYFKSVIQLIPARNESAIRRRTLVNLAAIQLSLGEVENAANTLATVEQEYHDISADLPRLLLRTQASMLERKAETEAAFKKLVEVIEHDEHWLENASLVSSEARRLEMFQTSRHALGVLISFYLTRMAESESAKTEVISWILRRKGIWSEMIGSERSAILEGKYPHLQKQFELRRTLRLRLARSRTAQLMSADANRDEDELISKWEAEKENLEEELARQVDEIRISRIIRTLSPQTIQERIPKGTVLVEWLRFHYGTQAEDSADISFADRYLAIVFSSNSTSPIQIVVSEDANALDNLISEYRRRIGEQSAGEPILGNQLRKILWDPVERVFGDAKSVLICPDSSISLIPFEVLPTGNGNERLGDRFSFRYLATARDLIRTEASVKSKGQPLIIGDPRFNWASDASREIAGVDFVNEINSGLSVQRGTDGDTLTFDRLFESGNEAREIARLLGVTKPYLGEDATKDRIMQSHRPGLLHLATHAYSLRKHLSIGGVDTFDTVAERDHNGSVAENPRVALTLVGLALAGAKTFVDGAQPPHPNCGNGLLSGSEVAELDLEGCQLCVISSCDSGLGEIVVGQGVFSLARAFSFAGVKTVVMSLWKQDDEAAKILMIEFYQAMAVQNLSVEAALCQAQAVVRANPLFTKPYYWAGWLVLGEGGRIDVSGWTEPEEIRSDDVTHGPEPLHLEEVVIDYANPQIDRSNRPTLLASLKRKRPILPAADAKWGRLIHVAAGLADSGSFGPAAQVIESYLREEPDSKTRARALCTMVDILRRGGDKTTNLHALLDEAEPLATGFDKGAVAFERGMLRATEESFHDAERLFAQAAEITRDALGDEDPSYVTTVIEWSAALNSLGRHDEAFQHLESIRSHTQRGDPYYFDFLYTLDRVYEGLNKPDEAERLVVEQIDILGDRVGVSILHQRHAALLQSCERLPEAEAAALTALKLAERDYGQHSDHAASAHHELGNVLAKAQRHQEAGRAFQKSLAVLEAIQNTHGRNYAATRWTLGVALREQGHLDEGEKELKHSLSIVEQYLGGPSYMDYWRIRRDLAITLEKKMEYELALDQFVEIAAILEQEPPNFDGLRTVLADVVYCLNVSGQAGSPEMESFARKQLALAERAPEIHHEAKLDALNNLAGAMGAQGRLGEARDIVLEAMELASKLDDGIEVKRQRLKSLVSLVQLDFLSGESDVLVHVHEGLELLEEISKPAKGAFESEVRSFFLQVIQSIESQPDESN